MTEQPLNRTAYHDFERPKDVRTGNTTRAESNVDMESYYRPLEVIHNTNLHGWGIAAGLEVQFLSVEPDSVRVKPGVAVQAAGTNAGRHISLAVTGKAETSTDPTRRKDLKIVEANGVRLHTTGMTGEKYITIQFWETPYIATQSSTYQYEHTPWLRVQNREDYDRSSLVLAQVSLDPQGNITQISPGPRQGLKLPAEGLNLYIPSQNDETVQNVEAAHISSRATGGIEVVVTHATDEIHLTAADSSFAKLSIAAEQIVATRSRDDKETITLIAEQGQVIAGSSGVAGSVIVRDASGNAAVTVQDGNITADGTVRAGASLISNGLEVTGHSDLHRTTLTNATISDRLEVIGDSSLQQTTLASATISDRLEVTGTSTLQQTTLTNATVSNELKVTGNSMLRQTTLTDATVSDELKVTDVNGRTGLTLQNSRLIAGNENTGGSVLINDTRGNTAVSLQSIGIGIGTVQPRTALDMGSGVLSGAANDYLKAQLTMSGGGTVTWAGVGGRLKWSSRFLCIAMARSGPFSDGHINLPQPQQDIPAAHVYDRQPRSANNDGIVLYSYEAIYAVHRVGGDQSAIHYEIVQYQHDFFAPSNWLLVAVVNADDNTVKLGTGAIISAKSSSSKGSSLPCGTILMWSGTFAAIPDGWALCNGEQGTPNLQDRFIVGAGKENAKSSGGPGQHQHRVTLNSTTFTTDKGGMHSHKMPLDWYDVNDAVRNSKGIIKDNFNAIDRGSDKVENVSTPTRTRDGKSDQEAVKHDHTVRVGFAVDSTLFTEEIRPKWYALCFIMKLY